MATTPQRNASINELAKAAVTADTDLQTMLRNMVRDAIAVGVHTLKHGSPTDKMAMMKTLMPHMLEALRQTEQTERSKVEMEAYNRIRAELTGTLDQLPPVAPVTTAKVT